MYVLSAGVSGNVCCLPFATSVTVEARSFEMTYSQVNYDAKDGLPVADLPVSRGNDRHSEAALDVGLIEAGQQAVSLERLEISVKILL